MSTSLELERLFHCPPPWIMGVLNITPDSFSDGGDFFSEEGALAQLGRLKLFGAHLVDIGGEATGPGSRALSAAEEIARLAPLLEHSPQKVELSVDTYKAETARFALERGTRIINDVSALRADPEMGAAVREHNAFVILMFAKGTGPLPHANDEPLAFQDVIRGVGEFLRHRIDFALSQGIPENRIIVDPGMGKFLSNNSEDSWMLLRQLDELREIVKPFPILIGASRKGFLGGKLSERDPVSQLAALAAIDKGAQLIRTHRVDMMNAFLTAWRKLHS